MSERTNAGWTEFAPGLWAKGPWRIQRGHGGWHWHYVVRLSPSAPAGTARTLTDAIAAVQIIDDAAREAGDE
jgi:hypothetical protein